MNRRNNFTVIEGRKDAMYKARKKLRKSKSDIWKGMYKKSSDVQKTAVCGVKYISYAEINTETDYVELNMMLIDMNIITEALSMLTYGELQRLFPVRKYFDGWKYEAKDYWSTIEWLKDKSIDEKIGENVDEMLWTYYNDDIMSFGIKQILVIDKLRKAAGEKSAMEEFIDFINKDAPPNKKIHTYSINREEGYIYDNMTGKTQPLSEPRKRVPEYLKVVK